MRLLLCTLALLLGAPVCAQQVVPQFGIDKTGTCRNLSVRDVLAASGINLGCIGTSGFGLTGTPTAPTAPVANNSTRVATTAYVDRAIGGPKFPINAYAADPTGVTASDTAWTAAMAAIGTGDGCVELGAGTYKFTSKKTVALTSAAHKSLCIRGAGMNVTRLLWSNVNGGLAITTDGQANAVQISGLSFLTGQVGGGTALSITNTGAFGGGDGNAYNIDQVYFAGDDRITQHESNLHYWTDAVITTAVSDINYDGVSVAGAGCSGVGNGITAQGNASTGTYGVIVNMSRSNFFCLNVGFTYGSYLQGVSISQTSFQGGNYGIFEQNGTVGTDQLSVVASQFSVNIADILINNISHTFIQGNLFFLTAPNSSAIAIFGGLMFHIIGNNVNGPGTVINSQTGVYVSANLSNSLGIVEGNSFYHLGKAVWLTSGSSHWNVQGNGYGGNLTDVLDQGTGNSIGVATQ